MCTHEIFCRAPMKFIKYWLPVIFSSLAILFFSSLPGKNIPSLFNGQAIIFHIAEYLVWAFLLSRAIKECYSASGRIKRLLLVCFLTLVFGGGDEFYQSFIPGRTPDLLDVAIDGVGGFLGGLFYR